MLPHGAERFVAGQLEILEGIAAGHPLPRVLEQIVRLVEAQAAGMLGSILLLDQERGVVRTGAAPSLPPGYCRAIDGLPIGPVAGSCGTAAYRGEPVIVEDIATDPLWAPYRDLVLPHGLRACWSWPIFSAERRVLGTFAMYYREPRGPSGLERDLVAAATHLAAVALGRHHTERALRESEARYRRIADTAREGIWLLDQAGGTLFANARVAELLGADVTGRRLVDFVDAPRRAETERELARAVGEGSGQRDVCFRRADGAELWTLVSVSAVTDDAGAVVGTLVMLTDITERKAAETRVRQLGRLYAVSSSVNEAISRIREPERLYELACRIAVEQGLMRLAWIGMHDAVADRLVPVARFGADDGYLDRIALSLRDERTGRGPAARALLSGAPAVTNDVATDPAFFWKEEALARGLRSCAAFPLTVRGRPIGVLSIYAEQPGYFSDEEMRVLTALADDISFGVESAGTEAELRQAQRIQSLGTLAGGIAHDFNNVLTAIIGNADIVARALPADAPAQRALRHIAQASARATHLVARILTFSRHQPPQRSPVTLREVVEEALKLLRATLPAMVQIEASCAADTPAVLADPTQIYQVVTNLGTNAAHAMRPRGGRLTVRLEAVSLEADDVPAGLRPGRHARLTVADTGCGMDTATLDRIFEPFFTTKPVGEGTGLGLSVVHGIVKSHEGAITVESHPGAGTTFRIYFPEAGAGAAAGAPPAAADVRGQGERVLHVDDEEAIVYMTGRLLEGAGYRVSGFTDARRALEAFCADPGGFDVVITDLAMPGLPGLDLAREIRRLRADVPVVLTSGYVRPEDATVLLDLPRAELVLKPRLVTDLAPALHRLLATAPSRPGGV
jgi:PAS domain S-box-containing protein